MEKWDLFVWCICPKSESRSLICPLTLRSGLFLRSSQGWCWSVARTVVGGGFSDAGKKSVEVCLRKCPGVSENERQRQRKRDGFTLCTGLWHSSVFSGASNDGKNALMLWNTHIHMQTGIYSVSRQYIDTQHSVLQDQQDHHQIPKLWPLS